LADKQRECEEIVSALELSQKTENLMKETLKDMNEELEQCGECVKAAEARASLLEAQLSSRTEELTDARNAIQHLEVNGSCRTMLRSLSGFFVRSKCRN
jgi:predicted nuclease with TOPRIM domain